MSDDDFAPMLEVGAIMPVKSNSNLYDLTKYRLFSQQMRAVSQQRDHSYFIPFLNFSSQNARQIAHIGTETARHGKQSG